MKLGLSAFAWTSTFTETDFELLPFVRECGYQAFEIPMFAPADLPHAAKIRRVFERNDLACTVCAILPAGVNPVSEDEAVRKASRQHLAACIETAAEIGAATVGGPVYAPIGYLPGRRPTCRDMGYAAEAIQSVTGLLESTGITLALEPVNRSETFLVRTAEDAAALCDEIGHPQVKVMIDTFHANIEEKNVGEAVGRLGPMLAHLHASENDRSTLGTGHVDFKGVLQTLKRNNYDGYVVVEGFGFPRQGHTGPGTLWAEPDVWPEDLARKSYDYLRGLIDNL